MITKTDLFSLSAQTCEQVAHIFKTSLESGLLTSQEDYLLKKYGYNQLPDQFPSWWQLLVRQCSSLFIILFFVIALFSLLLGEYVNGFIILLLTLVNVTVGFYQEYKATQTLQLLKKYLIASVRVIRDGQETEILSTHVLPGDLLVLRPGDKVAADARLIKAYNLFVDESSLTGEFGPVSKTAETMSQPAANLFEAHTLCFAGTVVTTGKGLAIVCATGINTAFGSIAQTTLETHPESSLVSGTRQLSTFILKLVGITLIFILGANLLFKGHTTSLGDLIIFSIALAVTAIPEALPIIVTFCLSRGVSTLAKNKVVVRRLSAIEDLGAIEILCTDKTGTLTENNMNVVEVFGKDPEQVVEYAALCSSFSHRKPGHSKDFDEALWEYLDPQVAKQLQSRSSLQEIPFDPQRRRNLVMYATSTGVELVMRGAVKEVMEHCIASDDLQLTEWISNNELQGNRILLVATRILQQKPADLAEQEHDFSLIGAIAFADPLKKTSLEAVHKAKKLGVIIKIISGDTPEVCAYVARQVGIIDTNDQVITGQQLSQLTLQEQEKLINHAVVFARVSPDQKLLIIQTMQLHHTVGYMGDGINDAPALKGANVSLAVQDAAAIVRDTADIILLKKSLLVIIDGIQEGRKTLANTMKYIKITLSANFGNFYAVAIASLLIPYVPMLPLHILVINLLSDVPMISISTDTVDPQSIKHPRSYSLHNILLIAVILGIVSSLFDFLTFLLLVRVSPGVLQTGWFVESVLSELVFIFSIRSYQPFFRATFPSKSLIMLSLLSGTIAIVLPLSAWGQYYMHFTPVPAFYLIAIGGIVLCYFVTSEIVKCWYYRLMGHIE
jgi:Mg2+-importing ATPase